jgi:hypothetical protein
MYDNIYIKINITKLYKIIQKLKIFIDYNNLQITK